MPSLVQSASNTATSGTTITVTLSATGAGNCLVVGIGTSTSSVSSVKLGGSAGNFAVAKAQTENAGGLGIIDCEVWTDQNCAGGQTSVVVTFAGTISNAYAWVMEWSGVSAVSAVDKTAGGGANSNAFSSGSSGVLTNANEVVIGAVVGAALGAVTITGPSSPWTNLSLLASGNYGFIASYETVTATTAQTYSGTVSGATTQFYAAVIVTLTEAAGGPAGTVQPAATVPVPRRRPARALWQRVTGQAFVKVPAPAQQPQPAPRRKPARAYIRFTPVTTTNAVPAPPAAGTVQARATVPVPRRRPSRALWRGNAVPGITGTAPAQQYRAAPRRNPARAIWRGITGQGFVQVPAPRQQYRTPPRRTPARAWVRFTPVTTHNVLPPRTLLISLASQAGTDDYGNAFPQGILATAGIIEGPVFEGADFIINSAGAFFYSAAPAAGNLTASSTSAAGTDQFGNNYLAGQSAYQSGAAASLNAGFIVLYTGTLAGGWTQQVTIETDGLGDLVLTANGQIDLNGTALVVNSGAAFTGDVNVNSANLGVGNGSTANINLNPKMATPPNQSLIAAGTASAAQICAWANGLYTSMKNRGMFN